MRKTLLLFALCLYILTGCRDTSFSNIEDINENIIEENESDVEKNNEKKFLSEDKPDFKIHFIDVGQGDAALVMCNDKYMLIDGGPSSASQIMYTYLENYGIDYLDYIICTHPDEDHVGGLSGALNYANVGVVYSSGGQNTKAYNSFITYVDKSGSYIEQPTLSSTFELGDAEIEILASNIGNDNDESIVLRIDYGNTSFLFTGDAETITEKYLLNNNKDIDCDVLKVSHHGSNSATSEEFLKKVSPKYAVISVGKYNTYGHPTTEVLDRLASENVEVFRTDLNGDIIIYSDGEELSIETENNKPITRGIDRNFDKTGKYKYCLNTNSMKIHYTDCDSVYEMDESHKLYTNEDREVLISEGYKPCGKCNPWEKLWEKELYL